VFLKSIELGNSSSKILPAFFCKAILLCLISVIYSAFVWAQSGIYQENTLKLEQSQLSGFSDDERVKVLLLNLLPSGMTETAAEEIAKALQLNIYNTNHFSVLGPSEWNLQIKDSDPTLADCHDIACGVMIGKLFHADKVLVGTIHSEIMLNERGKEEPSFILSLRLVDAKTNLTDFTDEVQFTDLQMHDELFRLAARISDNTLMLGKILDKKHSGITVNLGRAQGIKTGHRLVISRHVSKNDYGEKTQEKMFRNIALAEVIQVSDLSSEAVVIQKISAVSKGDQIQTYIDMEKLNRFVMQTRKELDTQKRIKPKKRVVQLGPSVAKETKDYVTWLNRFKHTKAQHDRWIYTSAGAGAATLFFLSGIIKTTGILSVLPWIAGAGTIYSGIQYFHFRDLLNEISTDGRSQGFITSSIRIKPPELQWTPLQNGIQIAWTKHF
jgi:hypothetical protein